MKKLLWLDDARNPFSDKIDWLEKYAPSYKEDSEIIWIQKYKSFVDYISNNPLPDKICFDHDIENFHISKSTYKEKTGYDCAKFLVDHCLINNLELPEWAIQSSNPAGSENIKSLLINYTKYYNSK